MRSNSNNKNIVCVVAHPDDEVLGLGGTLIKHVNCGDKVFIVILSEGEASKNNKNKHPATRTFQALRIFINDELEELKQGIEAAFEYLEPAGRLAVLTFHSLEHSIVRRRFREWAKPNLPRRLPVRGKLPSSANYIVKAVRPPDWEITNNPRARSALLQVIEKSG